MNIGEKIEIIDLFDDNKYDLNIGDVIKNNSNDEEYIVINIDRCEDPYYSAIELYPFIGFKKFMENNKNVNMKDLYNKSETLYYNEFNDQDDDTCTYIGHFPIHKSVYIELDNA